MKLTNKNKFPYEIVKALSKDRYTDDTEEPSDYSATSLLKSPRQLQLHRRHYSEISEDVSDRVWSLFGSIAHAILEEHAESSALVEKRLYCEVFDKKISGKLDHYSPDKSEITDYKVTSVYTVIYQSRIKEWTEQLNIYGWLFRRNGYDVRKLQIVAILRDWSETEASRKADYPQSPIVIIPLTLWDMPTAEAFVNNRVAFHKNAESLPDDQLPLCSEEDMWESPSKWAVMKEGRKSAVRVFDTQEEALELSGSMSDEAGNSIYIQERKGERRKCARYCSCNTFCSQWKGYLNEHTVCAM